MGSQARERDAMVAREINSAGGRLTGRSLDGAGHQVAHYEVNGRTGEFHYASTAATAGCGLLNARAKLRRELSALTALPPIDQPGSAIPERIPGRAEVDPLVAHRPGPTPPKPKLSVKEMVKSYLSMASLEEFMKTYGLKREAAETMLLSSRGQSAQKLRREINVKRAQMARLLRQPQPTKIAIVPPQPQPQPKRTYATKKAKTERDKRIATYCKFGVTTEEAAAMFNLKKTYVERIVRSHR